MSAAAFAARTGWTTKVLASDRSDIDQTAAHKLDAAAVLFAITVNGSANADPNTEYTISLTIGTLTAGNAMQFKYIFSKGTINGAGAHSFTEATAELNGTI